jgi:SPP1 family predicted phage head-tail adaptor
MADDAAQDLRGGVMQGGLLDRRVTFQRQVLADDGLGDHVAGWSDLMTVWASKADVSDGEQWRASQAQAHVTTRFRVRWSEAAAGVTPADRLLCEGEVYNIAGRKEIGRRVAVEFTAARLTDR